MADTCDFILAFMSNWEKFDLAGALACISDDMAFTPDPVSPPVIGRAEITKLWGFYMEQMQGYKMKVLNLAGSSAVVFLERIEYVVTAKQEHVELPIVGVFELEGGKIKAWRDYVDSTMLP